MAKDPRNCADMTELRAEIDALDREIVALFVRRAACIDRAIELKQEVDWPARIDSRVEAVLNNVRVAANESGLDADLMDRIWRMLIEWSIRREERVLGASGKDGDER